MAALEEFISLHKANVGDQQRLGQRFVNFYHRGTWPELFYERDDTVALKMISSWLEDNQYFDELPQTREI
jgi:hypothetical protein